MAQANNPLFRLANRILEAARGWQRTKPKSPPVIDIIQLEERIFYSASPFAMLDSNMDAASISPEQLEQVEALLGDLLKSGLAEPPPTTSGAAPSTQPVPESSSAPNDDLASIPDDEVATPVDTSLSAEAPSATHR